MPKNLVENQAIQWHPRFGASYPEADVSVTFRLIAPYKYPFLPTNCERPRL